MPTIFEKDGFKFSFTATSIVRFTSTFVTAVAKRCSSWKLRESQGLKLRELSKAEKVAEENKKLIIEKWHEHLD
jgi:hypothetical protein